jgi:hypothetical protein
LIDWLSDHCLISREHYFSYIQDENKFNDMYKHKRQYYYVKRMLIINYLCWLVEIYVNWNTHTHTHTHTYDYDYRLMWIKGPFQDEHNVFPLKFHLAIYPGKNHRLVASHWRTLSHNVVSSTPRHKRGSNSNFSGDKQWLHR